jgi:prolyl 4-hydroxylase
MEFIENIIYLPEILTEFECNQLIQKAETVGFQQAMLTGTDGKLFLNTKIRNSSRCMIDDETFAQILLDRISKYLPDYKNFKINERLRILKYRPGEYFRKHYDNYYSSSSMQGFLTIQIYLNDDYNGGSTRFWNHDTYFATKQRKGSVVIFGGDVLHDGEMVKEGVKYSLRTELMRPIGCN